MTRGLLLLVGVLQSCWFAPVAAGQCDGEFVRLGAANTGTGTIAGVVEWTPVGSGLRPVAFGPFTAIEGRPVPFLAELAEGGWRALGSPNAAVVGAATLGSSLVVCGPFTTIGGQAIARIAAYDGAVWSALGPAPDGDVQRLVRFGDELIAFGTFTRIGGIDALRVAAWNGSSWRALGGGWPGAAISQCTLNWNGLLVVGVSGTPTPSPGSQGLVAWDGAAWIDLGGGPPVSNPVGVVVTALEAHEGRLVVMTSHTVSGGSSVTRIDAWDGRAWSPLRAASSQQLNAMRSFGGRLLVGTLTNLTQWDGSAWTFDPHGSTGGVYAMTVFAGELVISGPFSGAVNSVARWDGVRWRGLGQGCDGWPSRLHAAAGQLFLSGGSIRTAGGVPANRLSVLGLEGWGPLGGGVDDGFVAKVLPDGDRLWVAGSFTSVAGTPASSIAAWDADHWTTLGAGTGGGAIATITKFGTSLVAAGQFLQAGGQPANRIAIWDGAAWSSLGQGFADGAVNATAVYADRLYAAGSFTRSGGSSINRVARWNGVSWESTGLGTSGVGYALAVAHGRLYAGGILTLGQIGGVASWDGQAWAALGSGIRSGNQPGSAIHLIVLDQRLLVTGSFNAAGGQPCAGEALWDGQAWSVQPDPAYSVADAAMVGSDQVELHAPSHLDEFGHAQLHGRISRLGSSGWSEPWGEWNGALASAGVYQGRVVVGGQFTFADRSIAVGMARWRAGTLPTAHASIDEVQARPGSRVELVVEVDGVPTPVIRWTRDGEPVLDGTSGSGAEISGATTARLTITGVGQPDGGLYELHAENPCGSASQGIRLTVCIADFNNDGFLDFFDYLDFVSCFEGQGCPSPDPLAADINADGFVDFFDYGDFVDAFETGC